MGRVVAIFAVVLLLAGGAGFYFFKIYRPAEDLKNAQAEIAAWETRWGLARDCLLGKAPGSAKTSEALAIHEMSPDPWDRGRCTPLIGKLTRGEADDTGIPAIETAWNDVDKAAQKAAAAFATHVGSSTTIVRDPLPAALDSLDIARSYLRKAAQLPATSQAGGVLAPASILPLQDGKERVVDVVVDAIPSAHGVVLFGQTESRRVQVTLTAGGAAKVDRTGPASLRAVPDTSWGTSPAGDALRVGSFDAEGAMPSVLSEIKAPSAAAVIGSLKQGTVVAMGAAEVYFARVKDSVVTVDPVIKGTGFASSLDADGRAVIIWDQDRKYKARIIVATADGPTVDLPDDMSMLPCLTKGIAWTQSGTQAYGFGGMAPLVRADIGEGMRLQGCTPDGALFRNYTGDDMDAICTDSCRKAKRPSGAPSQSALTIVGGNLVAIAAHNGVLGVWREGAAPAFFSLTETIRPAAAEASGVTAMAMTDDKVIDILARGEKGYVVVRIPAH